MLASRITRLTTLALLLTALLHVQLHGQEQTNFDVHSIYQNLDSAVSRQTGGTVSLIDPWWDSHVSQSQRRNLESIPTDIHTLIYFAIKYSNQIRIAKENPIIVETGITEADSAFDWTRFVNSNWLDSSEPVTNSLQAGGNQSRLNDNIFQLSAGARKVTRFGGQFDVSQQFGWQNNNSTFFIPEDQATSQLTFNFTQPLLRGRGFAFNNSLIVLAQIDTAVAEQQFLAEVQDQLLEVVRTYWALYLERASLTQQVRLYLNTERIVEALRSRQTIDAQRTQLITASSALESRRADLIRARTAVINSETRLRGLINAPELSRSDLAEIVPVDRPGIDFYDADLKNEIQIAIQNRPEVQIATQEIKGAATRLNIAEHELLPVLDLVTQLYANGLQGNNDFGGSFIDQFADGAPSYSIGFNYELPVGNRLARARRTRRCVEARQLQARYDQTLANIQTEVDIAVRELITSYREIQATSRALSAAEAEVRTIESRWSRFIDGNANSSLNLESLLAAQERVTEAEREYVNTLLIYNLAIVNLKRANGTLLDCENIVVNRNCDNDCGPSLELDKAGPSNSSLIPGHSSQEFINSSGGSGTRTITSPIGANESSRRSGTAQPFETTSTSGESGIKPMRAASIEGIGKSIKKTVREISTRR